MIAKLLVECDKVPAIEFAVAITNKNKVEKIKWGDWDWIRLRWNDWELEVVSAVEAKKMIKKGLL